MFGYVHFAYVCMLQSGFSFKNFNRNKRYIYMNIYIVFVYVHVAYMCMLQSDFSFKNLIWPTSRPFCTFGQNQHHCDRYEITTCTNEIHKARHSILLWPQASGLKQIKAIHSSYSCLLFMKNAIRPFCLKKARVSRSFHSQCSLYYILIRKDEQWLLCDKIQYNT